MDAEVWFTRHSMDEAARLLRRWYAWPLFLLGNIQGIAVIIAVVVIGISLIVRNISPSNPDLPLAAIGVVLTGAPIAYFLWLRKREERNAVAALAKVNPLKLTFTAEGLHTSEKSGARSFTPWSSFDGYREGRHVILLRESDTSEYRVIPTNTVPPYDPQQIISAIRSNLVEIR